MRKLMWFTLGFGAACAVCGYWGSTWFGVIAVFAILLAVFAMLLRRKWDAAKIGAVAAIGILSGVALFSAYSGIFLRPAFNVDGYTESLTAEVTDYSYETAYGIAAEAKVQLYGRQYDVLLYLNENRQLIPGDVVRGQFRMRCTLGGKEDPTYHRGNGIQLLCYPKSEITVEETQTIPWRYYPAMLRRQLTVLIEDLFPSDTAFFAKALLLGDRTDMDYTVSTAFKVSGISHIVAVSGLHISILFAVVALLCGKRRLLMTLIGIPVLLLFAAVAGFTPSVARACFMQILMLVGLLLNKEYDPPTALSFAALVMLAMNPMVITSASFQLSVGCMAGIFLFSKRIGQWISGFSVWKNRKGRGFVVRLRNWISGGVSVTLSAMFFTTPLVAYYFGAVSLIGILTNLVTLWAVSLIFYGIMAVCLLSLLWTGGATGLAWCVSWLIRFVLWTAKFFASFPLAAVYTTSIYIIGWLVLCYGLIFIFLTVKKRQPFVLICCSICGLCVALLLSWAEPMLDDTRMTVLDVGQGQCILLQCKGRNILLDCGGDRDTEAADLAAETLLAQGISRLDGVIVTHYDRDHAGGMGYLLSRIPADAVFLPNSPDEDALLESILPHCAGKEIFVGEDIRLQWDDAELTIFAPILSTSDNERGLCVLFGNEKCDILITGDLSSLGERLLLMEKQIPELTALVVGHHGSKHSTCQPLLDATTPQYAFISVGADNSYGHPNGAVLQRLEACGCTVYRTDEHGTIIFRR